MAVLHDDHSSSAASASAAFSQLLSAAEAASVDHSRTAATVATTTAAGGGGVDYQFNANGRRDSSVGDGYAVPEVRDGHVNGSSIAVGNGTAEERPQKRRKVALACDGCRERKTRCDGERPVCGSCKRRSRVPGQCVYKTESVRTSVADGSIEALHNRIRELESRYRRDSVLSSSGSPMSAGHQSQSGVGNHRYESEEPQSVFSPGQDHAHVDGVRKLSVDQVLSSPWQPIQNGSGDYGQRHPGTIPNGHGHSRAISLPSQSALSSTPQYVPHTTISTSSDGDNRQPASRPTSESQDTGDNPSPIDAMSAISTTNDNDPGVGGNFYGGSAASFVQQIFETISSKTGYPKYQTSPQSHQTSTIPHSLSSKLKEKNPLAMLCEQRPRLQLEDFTLPPRHLADHLIGRYWTKVHTLYPFLHKPTFVKAYDRLWSSEPDAIPLVPSSGAGLGNSIDGSPDTSLFYCALNALFALGCQFSDVPIKQRQSVSNVFFQQSKQLLRLDVLGNGSISLVQTLLLVAQYLQSTPYPTRCWNSIGIACGVAQGLGLHLENSKTQSLPSLELEIRRRTWYGCVTLDMVVSMTLGRPTMTLHSSAVPLPTAIDDEHLIPGAQNCTQPANIFSRTTFFVQTIKLYKILGTILSSVYEPWSGGNDSRSTTTNGSNTTSEGTGFDTIMPLDSALGRFHAEVPELLRWPPRTPGPDGVVHSSTGLKFPDPDLQILARQANVLHARYLHLRILLYRPVFTQLCRTPPASATSSAVPAPPQLTTTPAPTSETMTSLFATGCALSCVSAACEILSLVHSNLHNATGAWWYVFYTHTAGMVLIMAGLCGPIQGVLDSAGVERAWGFLREVLGEQGFGWSGTARRCWKGLEGLRARVGGPGITGDKQQAAAERFDLTMEDPPTPPDLFEGEEGGGDGNPRTLPWDVGDGAWWNGPTFDLFLEGSPGELDPGL